MSICSLENMRVYRVIASKSIYLPLPVIAYLSVFTDFYDK